MHEWNAQMLFKSKQSNIHEQVRRSRKTSKRDTMPGVLPQVTTNQYCYDVQMFAEEVQSEHYTRR